MARQKDSRAGFHGHDAGRRLPGAGNRVGARCQALHLCSPTRPAGSTSICSPC